MELYIPIGTCLMLLNFSKVDYSRKMANNNEGNHTLEILIERDSPLSEMHDQQQQKEYTQTQTHFKNKLFQKLNKSKISISSSQTTS